MPGAAETDDKGELVTKYHPVTLADGTSWVRKPESTLDWSSYRFEMVMTDGTRHDFAFSAKDDADAKRKVSERIATTEHAGGTFKLSRLLNAKEIPLAAEEVVSEGKATAKATKQAEKNAKDANAEKADKNQA